MDELLRTWSERAGVTAAAVPGLVVASLGAVLALVVAVRAPLLEHAGAGPPAGPVPVATVTPPPVEHVVVHVAGAVASPGVVELAAGARVADAIAAVGGVAGDAAVAAINLARPVVDGERLVVPTHDQVAAGTAPGPGPQQTDAEATGLLSDGRVDLNAATVAQLQQLPGIGPVLAGRIVDHRASVGGFDEAVALREVPGIGEATWAELRDLVGVAGEP